MNSLHAINRKAFNLILFGIASLIMGCNDPYFTSGHYEGTLKLSQQTRNMEFVKNFPSTSFVTMDVSKGEHGISKIVVGDLKKNNFFSIDITKIGNGLYGLELPNTETILFRPMPIAPKTHYEQCYLSYEKYKVELCKSQNELELRVAFNSTKKSPIQTWQPLFSLKGGIFLRDDSELSEPSRLMTLSDSTVRVLSKNFGSRMEYQYLILARELASSRYFDLLPSAKGYTGKTFGKLFPDASVPLYLYNQIQDLGEFLIPLNWDIAPVDPFQVRALNDVHQIMRANLAAQVMVMSYDFDFHKSEMYYNGQFSDRLGLVTQQAKNLVTRNRINPEIVDLLNFEMEKLKSDQAQLQEVQDLDLQSFAKTLGFLSPHSVKDIKIDMDEIVFEKKRPLKVNDLARSIEDRSLEVRQYESLLQGAMHGRKDIRFAKMNVVGELVNLGQEVDSSPVALKMARNQRAQISFDQARTVINRYNLLLDIYKSSIQLFETQNKLLNQQLEIIKAASEDLLSQEGIEINHDQFKELIENHLFAYIIKNGLYAQLRSTYTILERMLMSGYFARIHQMGQDLDLEYFEQDIHLNANL